MSTYKCFAGGHYPEFVWLPILYFCSGRYYCGVTCVRIAGRHYFDLQFNLEDMFNTLSIVLSLINSLYKV